tara:strand:+ start:1977 stop:2933 length:957 start_codon:yes stop_codon:yes gene_type:complete
MRILLGLLFLLTVTSCYGFNKLDVKLTVVDENDVAIPNANTRIIFHDLRERALAKGITNAEGMVSAQGETYIELEVSAEKEGYYKSQLKLDTRKENDAGKLVVSDQDIKLVLRKKNNPIPLYAKTFSGKLPILNKEVGFDFSKSDWVKPYGQGDVKDLILFVEKKFESADDYYAKLNLIFPQDGEGITTFKSEVEYSELTSPYHASINANYLENKKLITGKEPNRGYINSPYEDYIFRVRVLKNEEDEIIEANYGKILGGIKVFVGFNDNPPGIKFTYYFNPEVNDTNLEFDPKRNLFTNLKNEELVTLLKNFTSETR